MESGLINICYQNSLLQCLANTEPFISRILRIPLQDGKEGKPGGQLLAVPPCLRSCSGCCARW